MSSALAQPTWRRRTVVRLARTFLAGVVGLALGATPASADEFKIGILVDPAVGESSGPTFMEGF